MGRADVLLNMASHILGIADEERLTNRELVAVMMMVHNLATVRDDGEDAMAARHVETTLEHVECSKAIN